MADARTAAARAIALAGPAGTGKTTLMEALLHRAGAVTRQGAVADHTSIGDASAEARTRGQSTELNLASFSFMDDRYAIIDCPGSVEFAADGDQALLACDLVVAVVDPQPDKAVLLQPLMKRLEQTATPHAIFVNKIDQAHGRLRDLLVALQSVSGRPVVARQLPIWEDEHVKGYVDLALERAFEYRPGAQSVRIDIPADLAQEEADERFHMLEQLADFDDTLMEQLLEDATPQRDMVFDDLAREMREGLIVPVFFGSALNGEGMFRLLKALRHEAPSPDAAAARIGATGDSVFVFKTAHAGQAGKQAYGRVMSGKLADGAELTRVDGETGRVGGLFSLLGATTRKIPSAQTGDVVAIGKAENARAGELLSANGQKLTARISAEPRIPVYAVAIEAKDRKDDVKLSGALHKLIEEDAALRLIHDPDQHQSLLEGQGEGHLKVAIDRLRRQFGVEVVSHQPKTPYKETIKKSVTQRGRHKKQSGGHGQFGDVVVEVKPAARGQGFEFASRITGGVVPKQWVPAVEDGLRDALERGPLGFPVVDVAAALIDGSYHTVDSSELAFRTAGRIAMSEALEACAPYLLEPIEKVTIYAPSHATSKITSAISSRRGQILGFEGREDWPGWDRIEVYLPHAERHDLIVELRSQTQGLGHFESAFDHLAEVSGRIADDIVQKQKAAA